MKKFVIAVCVVALLAGGIVLVHMSNKHKAIELAKEFVAQKYDFEVAYVDSRYSWIDPAMYHVYFTRTDPSIKFCVLVQSDFTIDEDRVHEDTAYAADNYFQQWFRMEAKRYFENLFATLESVQSANLYVNNSALYAFAYPAGATFEDDIDTLVRKMDYTLVVDLQDVSDNMLEFALQKIADTLAEREIYPSGIQLWDSEHQNLLFSDYDWQSEK